MRRTHFSFFILAFSTLFAWSTQAADVCGRVPSNAPVPIQYCFTPTGSDSTLVFLHGAGSSVTGRDFYATDAVYKSFAARKIQAPGLLKITFGKLNFLTGLPDITGKRTDIDEAQNAIVYALTTLGRKTEKVYLFGESMGGHNAIQIFTRHPDLYDKVVLACPASTVISPFSADADWYVNLSKQGATPLYSFGYKAMMVARFMTPQNWNMLSPLNYLKRSYGGNHQQPVLIAGVKPDAFGFDSVLDVLAAEFVKKGHPTARTTTLANHCAVEGSAIADFLAQ